METTMNFKGNDVVFRVHRDKSKVLADGSPDPAWVYEEAHRCLPTDGRTLAQHLIACKQDAETRAAAVPPPVPPRKKASATTTKTQTMTTQVATAVEPPKKTGLASGLTSRVVGNNVVVSVVDGDTLIGEWSWGGTPNEGQTFEQHFDSCERESLLLAEHALKQAMPTDTPLKLNI